MAVSVYTCCAVMSVRTVKTLCLSLFQLTYWCMQVTCKPLNGIVRQRYEQFVEKQCSESIVLNIISQLSIDMHGELVQLRSDELITHGAVHFNMMVGMRGVALMALYNGHSTVRAFHCKHCKGSAFG